MSALEQALGRVEYAGLTGLLRRLARVREESLTIDGVRVPLYVRRGRGAPIVMLHGFGADKGIGHVPQFEAPRRIARLVERFVRRVSLVD